MAERMEGDYPRWFWALVALGALVAGFFPLFIYLWSRSQVRPLEEANARQCLTNLQSLWQAAALYEVDNGALPPADRWTDALTPVLAGMPGSGQLLRCPSFDAPWGYAMQDGMGGRRKSEIGKPDEALAFYDSSAGRPNAHDALSSFPKKERHLGRGNAVFADGHAAALRPEVVGRYVVPVTHG